VAREIEGQQVAEMGRGTVAREIEGQQIVEMEMRQAKMYEMPVAEVVAEMGPGKPAELDSGECAADGDGTGREVGA
jgi:hypothetical protein